MHLARSICLLFSFLAVASPAQASVTAGPGAPVELRFYAAASLRDVLRELTPALERLGMQHATRPGQADFGGISELGPAISAVIHRAVLEVNEEGAEAAAATAVVMTLGAMLPVEQPFHLRADRPFLLAIRDRHTGIILFLGAVVDPS